MKVQSLPNAAHLRPQKPSARETPHAVIEPNTNCNIRCRCCYAIEHPVVKPLDQVRAEIDVACARRNLDALSLLGGEPTLHPDLPEIVRYVKSKGLVCQVLTNGVRLLGPEGPALLAALQEAGVDRFLVHIDSGQRHVHPDLDAARHAIAALLEPRRQLFGFSITLYEGEEAEIPRILRAFARYRWFDGVLVTLALDFDAAFAAGAVTGGPTMEGVVAAMDRELHVAPAAYLPSSLDDDEVCWLMWFYWTNAVTGATFALSPELNRAMKWLYRATHDHPFFADTLDPEHLGAALVASGLAETALHPSRLGALRRLVAGARSTADLRFHYAVVQQAPRIEPASGRLQICWQCPDAVVRHDRLVPVCIAGRLDPLGAGTPKAPRAVIEDVYRHLGEEPPR